MFAMLLRPETGARFVYEQSKGNQRRTAKLLGISRATLARHLKNRAAE
jgi:DNA-binding protein Fis